MTLNFILFYFPQVRGPPRARVSPPPIPLLLLLGQFQHIKEEPALRGPPVPLLGPLLPPPALLGVGRGEGLPGAALLPRAGRHRAQRRSGQHRAGALHRQGRQVTAEEVSRLKWGHTSCFRKGDKDHYYSLRRRRRTCFLYLCMCEA